MPARPSITGTVLGSTATAVKPPRAAASSPLVMPCFPFLAGLAEVGPKVHPSRAGVQGLVPDLRGLALGDALADAADHAITHQDVHHRIVVGQSGSTTFTCFGHVVHRRYRINGAIGQQEWREQDEQFRQLAAWSSSANVLEVRH